MTCPFCSTERPCLGDFNVEKALLSCLIQAPETQVDAALRLVTTDDFSHEATGMLFEIITRRHQASESVDSVSLMSYLYDKGLIEQITPLFLSECTTASPNPTHTAFYAQTVLDFSKRRKMVRIAHDLARAAQDGGNDGWRDDAVDVMRRADSALMGKDGDEIVSIKDVAGHYSDALERDITQGIDPAIPTGIAGLDKLMDGGVRREYILIGGLQGHGKSLLAMQIAGALCRSGRRGFVIGYDMTPIQVFMRDLARETNVPLSQIMGRSEIAGMDFQSVTRGISRMMEWPVWYTKSPYITFETAAAHARSLHRQKPLDFVVLDFLQKVPLARKGKERTDEALVALSRRVWALQRELGCTLIAPVQLNDDGLIREARGLLDDPEVFVRIEMETFENQDGEMEAGDNGFLRLMKNRFGPKDRRIPVFRNGPLQRFEDREYTKPSTQPKKGWNNRN